MAHLHHCFNTTLLSAAYEAIMELLKSSPRDCYAIVQETTVTIIARLEELLHHKQANNEKTGGNFNDLQSLLCATLQVTLIGTSVIARTTSEDSFSDYISRNFLVKISLSARCT